MNLSSLIELSIEQRLDLVNDLWDSIIDDQNSLKVSVQQKEMLDKRLNDYLSGATPSIPADEALSAIQKKYGI